MANTKKGGHGGKRPGSGRPSTGLTRLRDDADARINDLVGDKLVDIVEALVGLAVGCKAERVLPDGKALVYTTLPDFKAASYLLDRIAGRPKQAITVDPAKIDIRAASALTAAAAVAYKDPADDDDRGDARPGLAD